MLKTYCKLMERTKEKICVKNLSEKRLSLEYFVIYETVTVDNDGLQFAIYLYMTEG